MGAGGGGGEGGMGEGGILLTIFVFFLFPRYAQNMPKTCPRLAQDIARYPQDFKNISPRHAQDIQGGVKQ